MPKLPRSTSSATSSMASGTIPSRPAKPHPDRLRIMHLFPDMPLAPTVTHEAIRPLPDIAGAAAGVLRSLQMLVGAGAGALVTLIVDYTRPPLAMACIMVASALGALTIYIALLGWSERDRGP